MIDKRIFKILDKSLLVKLVGITILQALFIVAQAILLTNIIHMIYYGSFDDRWIYFVLGFSICFILSVFLRLVIKDIGYSHSKEKGELLRKELLDKIVSRGLILGHEGSGKLASSFMDGINNIENYILLITVKVISMMVIPIVILLAILYYDVISAVILLIVFPISIIFMMLFGLAAKNKAEKQFKGYQMLARFFVDSIKGLRDLRLLGRSREHSKKVFKVSEEYRKATMNTLKVALLSTFSLDFFTTLSIAVVAVFMGLRLIEGNLDLYPALIVLILCPDYFNPLKQFAEDYHATLNGKLALNYVDTVREMGTKKSSDDIINFIYKNSDGISIKNLNLYYGDYHALKNINIEIKSFDKLCILGASGCGKTSLLNSIAGILDVNGEFIIGNNKFDSLYNTNFRENILYLPQEPYIFSMSLIDNLRLYNSDATLEEVIDVCKKVHLDILIDDLELGLDTIMGDNNRPVSGGEKQRISIARAMLNHDKSILIFDELAAHIDIETELEIKEYILNLFKDRLVILATHRLHWVKDCEHIVLMKDGSVIADENRESIYQNKEFKDMSYSMRGKIYE